MKTTLVFLAVSSCVLVAFAEKKDPELKNGPSGFQTFRGSKSSKTIDFTNKQTKGKKKGSHSGMGMATGNSADLGVAGQKLTSTLNGKKGVEAARNGEKAEAKDSGNKNYNANGKGKSANADVEGTKVKKAKAGNKEISGQYNKNTKSADAKETNGNGKWQSNLKGKKGTATDSKNQKATLNGISKNSRRVQGRAKGKSFIGGNSKKTSKTKYSYTRVQKKRGRGRVQYTSQTKKKGGAEAQRLVQGRRKVLYQSSVNKKNEVGLYDKGKQIATMKVLKTKEVPCQNLKKNIWSGKGNDNFIDKKSLKVKYPQTNGEYQFPSCMDIEAAVTLPQGVKVKDLAAAVTLITPGCGEFVCSKGTECLSHQCFYKNLCPDEKAQPSQKHKDAGDFVFSQSDHNACDDNYPAGGKHVIKFHYCPDVEAQMAKDEKCRTTLTSAVAVSSMQVQIDMWQVKKRPMGCNVNKKADTSNVQKLGCTRVLIDYRMKWKNLPDFAGFSNQAGKVLDSTNCNLGKRPCIGHSGGGLFGNLGGLFGGKGKK